jgi:hypothetical protein
MRRGRSTGRDWRGTLGGRGPSGCDGCTGAYEPPHAEGTTAEFAAQLAELVAAGRRSETAERFLSLVGAPPEALAQLKAAPCWPHLMSCANTLPYVIALCNGGSVPVDRLARIRTRTLPLAGARARTGPVREHGP